MVAQPVDIGQDAMELNLLTMTPVEVVTMRMRAALLRRLGWLQALWGAAEAPPGWFCAIVNGDDLATEQVWRQADPTGRELTELIDLCDAALAGPAGRFRARLAQLAASREAKEKALSVPASPAVEIVIPAEWTKLLRDDVATAKVELMRVRTEFQKAFANGFVAAGFERSPTQPRYLLYDSRELESLQT